MALRYMDRTNNTTYMCHNIMTLFQFLGDLSSLMHGELIYYIVKYMPNTDSFVEKIITLPNYSPDPMFIDVIFYFGIVKNKLSKDVYKKLGVSTGTWRDRFE